MIKEWATVVSWQNGQALVSCDVKASCSSCASRAGCGSRVLNKLGPQTTHTIVVPCDEPLVPGQKVELGIAEGSLRPHIGARFPLARAVEALEMLRARKSTGKIVVTVD